MDSGHTRKERKDQEVKFVTHSHKVTTFLALFLQVFVCVISVCHPLTSECKLIQTHLSSKKWKDNEGPEVIWN